MHVRVFVVNQYLFIDIFMFLNRNTDHNCRKDLPIIAPFILRPLLILLLKHLSCLCFLSWPNHRCCTTVACFPPITGFGKCAVFDITHTFQAFVSFGPNHKCYPRVLGKGLMHWVAPNEGRRDAFLLLTYKYPLRQVL